MMKLDSRATKKTQKQEGAHYTPAGLAEFVARHLAAVCDAPHPRVLDPAVGDGELLLAFGKAFERDCTLNGFDLDEVAVENAATRLLAELPEHTGKVLRQDFLDFALEHRDDSLFSTPASYDVVIANPPYVRTQVMGAARSQLLAQQFDLGGRVDLSFAFIQGIADVLREGGVAGIIVSNRFMTTKAGSQVRERILSRFEILHIWDFGDTKLFEAAVLPAVLLVRKRHQVDQPNPRFTSIYSTAEPPVHHATTVYEALSNGSGAVAVSGTTFLVQHGILNHGDAPNGTWRIATESGDTWLDTVLQHTFCTFGEIGKIRVGVKTTADKVFVRKDWTALPEEMRPELLRPLITHHAARRFKSLPADRQILYTHEDRAGKKAVIDLATYPRSRCYLESHRATLEARTYVIESGRQWYEIWVPQHPALWPVPKLVFPDITESPTFWMSLDGEVINGDCYWLAAEDRTDNDLLWLALAVGNSRFIESFYDHAFNNKLYAGRRRFMTQYVEKFPLPSPDLAVSREIVSLTRRIHELTPGAEADALAATIDRLVESAFGLAEKALG
ncbi:MAG: N-6 DNA methylase [Prosthecobacter sp.]|uniref:Eco57I restriction-modification methylase domain-containing protein n=1 Tax=Prosthecobacter sp. TaxID=1965333 RepID=UPI003BB208F3